MMNLSNIDMTEKLKLNTLILLIIRETYQTFRNFG